MSILTANELKSGGIHVIESALTGQSEVIISVRGKQRFVIMDVAQYHYLRECELDAALAQSQADLAAGRMKRESAQAHIQRLETMLTPKSQPSSKIAPVKTRNKG